MEKTDLFGKIITVVILVTLLIVAPLMDRLGRHYQIMAYKEASKHISLYVTRPEQYIADDGHWQYVCTGYGYGPILYRR